MSVQRVVRRLRWPLAALAAAAAGALLLPGVAWAPQFTGGPSVRVTPNERVEFKWRTDVTWFGKVEVFSSPDGTGLVLNRRSEDFGGTRVAATEHAVSVDVVSPLAADTTYYFRITSTDPTNPLLEFATPTPLPPLFTGAPAIGDVVVDQVGVDAARVSWQANVIGFGRVEYGPTTAYGRTVDDGLNVTDHAFTLTGLEPATTYYFRVGNRHALDGDDLAVTTGSFTTLSLFSGQFLEPLTQSSDPASPVVNTGKNGRVIPVKVQIDQGDAAITDLNAPGPVTIAASKLACGDSAGSDPVSSYADAGESSAGTNQFRYDATIEAWVYNLDTKALGLVTGNCYRIDVSVDGTQITNAFAVFQPT